MESDEDKSGEMIVDHAENGSIIGIEVLSASKNFR